MSFAFRASLTGCAFALSQLALAQPPATPGPGGPGGGRGGFAAAPQPNVTIATQMLARGDRDADQKLTRAEFLAVADAWFTQLDIDGLGRVAQEDFLQRFDSVLTPGGGRRGGRGGTPGGNALALFLATDRNRDAALTRAELKENFTAWFAAWDADRDERLDSAELQKGLNAVLPRNNMSGAAGRETQDPIPGLPKPPPSPILSAADSMKSVKLVDGFTLELAAAEPLIEDPVAMSFDEDGRAYVVEMRGYMLDIDRKGERDPISRITRLEDTDGDGRFDKSTVFVDGLILPRAVAALRGGILYVSDYQLFYARDTDGDGKADKTELVDADYGRGNVEHAANGLFRAMDNWIYNGESPARYRLIGDTLVKQETELRGQWGMTQDNYGRLLYNVNNSQLLGDFSPPNYLSRNPHHTTSAGLNLFVSTDQRVFPIRMTTAVNRGYSPDVLSPEGKVYVFASSCAPLVYRGDNFPAEFQGNAFVADPAVNLLKRNLVSDRNLTLSSSFAYPDREFLASTDERFRPVNLYNGPDGALWVVDLYHGIAQYGQFMTAYLKRDTLERGLDKGIHHGRIYRVVSNAKKPTAFPKLASASSAALVERLADANGWIRDTAQRLLVERSDRSVAPALIKTVTSSRNALARIHALWTLEGLFAAVPTAAANPATPAPAAPNGTTSLRLLKLDAASSPEAPAAPDDVLAACLKATTDSDPKVQAAAIRVSEYLAAGNAARQRALLTQLGRVDLNSAPEVAFQAALSAGNLPKPEALPLIAQILTRHAEHLVIREAVLSGLKNAELNLLRNLLAHADWSQSRPGRSSVLQALASAVMKERDAANIETLLSLVASQASAPAWRQTALLTGIASNVTAQPARPIALRAAPTALDSIAGDAAAQVAQIKTLFSWPGHQSAGAEKVAARPLTAEESARVTAGSTVYQQICAGCHGPAGQGVTPSAPPLVNSDWVLGPEQRLIRLVLHGMKGPLKVNGVNYAPPAILPEMPALAAAQDDTQLAAALTFIRRSWGHEATPIAPAQITAVRSSVTRAQPWTEAELLEIK